MLVLFSTFECKFYFKVLIIDTAIVIHGMSSVPAGPGQLEWQASFVFMLPGKLLHSQCRFLMQIRIAILNEV